MIQDIVSDKDENVFLVWVKGNTIIKCTDYFKISWGVIWSSSDLLVEFSKDCYRTINQSFALKGEFFA